MSVPDYQSIMLPLLRLAADREEHPLRGAVEALADQFGLSDEERKELLPSGRQATFDNRVGWARTYMKKAGLLESTRRGHVKITSRRLSVLQQNPREINVDYLERFPEFVEFRLRKVSGVDSGERDTQSQQTPEEALEAAYLTLRQGLASELIQTIKGCSPAFFERLVVDILVKMGYGGTRRDAGQAVGRSGDEGVDGIIKEDRLGHDIIYVQAKRWDNPVGRPEVQKFAGALQGHRARKGSFITTSAFTKDAEDYASRIDTRIILIDGEALAHLMVDHNVGVGPVASYEVKGIDSDYFTEG
jgi:restriction system protein